MPLESVPALSLAVSLRNIAEHIRENGDKYCGKNQQAAKGNYQAEEVIRLMVDGEVARIDIKGKYICPVQPPDTSHKAENGV